LPALQFMMSIKYKLTLTIMGISIGAVMLTVAAITSYLIYDMRIGKAHELQVNAALTGDRNSAALLFLDDDRARKNLEMFRLSPSVLTACIYDAKGALFADYHVNSHDCPPQVSLLPPNQDNLLTIAQDIVEGGSSIGKVFIASDTREIDAYIKKILFISGSVTILVLVGTVLLAFYFQRTISAPILELAETAQTITANGDYTLSAREGYPDETGMLARAFNAMLTEVRKRDDELMHSNETLEHKVVERTRALEDAMHSAEAASAAKSEFLRNMSHEFRTPLHALISFSSYGIREHLSAPAAQIKQYFELIQSGANRLSKLVDEVLDLARLEHGEHVFSFTRSDLRDAISASMEMMRSLAQDKHITLQCQADEQAAYTVCDQDKIVQVITNLLGNAVKFSPQGGTITLALQRANLHDQPAISISVIDQGIGIPEEEKEMIFESFKQSSRTNTGAGGTGLGLSICRRIVEAHNGSIWAENNVPPPGAHVTFVIPALLEEGKKIIRLQEMEGLRP